MSRIPLYVAFAMCLLIFFTASVRTFKLPGAIDTAKRLEANFVKAKPKLPRFRSFFQIPASREVHDVVVIMDGSGSVSSCEFDKAKMALRYLLTMKNNYVDLKYAAITFSDSATVNFNFLPEYFAVGQMNRITHPGGGSNTQAALVKAMELFENSWAGRRPNADKKIVLLVTDGGSNSFSQTKAKAQELKKSGIEIFVIAVSGYFNGIAEIKEVASTPPEKFFYAASGLWEVVKQIAKHISPPVSIGDYKC